jgi:hypothetical protein
MTSEQADAVLAKHKEASKQLNEQEKSLKKSFT